MTFVFRNLAWRIVILCSESLIIVWLLQVIPEILTAILFFYSCFCIGHRCWNFFTQHNFCSLTNIEELIDLRNMKTDNLKFRIDLCNLSMDCWSVTQWMIIFKGRLLKTSLIEACPVNESLYMVFRSHISFWADLATNCFSKLWLLSIQSDAKSPFQAFYTAFWSCYSVWLESEQKPFPLKCQFRSAAFNALHRIQSKTWEFIPIPYSYPETGEWSKDSAK